MDGHDQPVVVAAQPSQGEAQQWWAVQGEAVGVIVGGEPGQLGHSLGLGAPG